MMSPPSDGFVNASLVFLCIAVRMQQLWYAEINQEVALLNERPDTGRDERH